MSQYEAKYHGESDEADDEYEPRARASPTLPADYDSSSPTESDLNSPEHTPTTFTHSTMNAVSPRGLITEWSAEQVADFVASLGLGGYRNTLIQEGITGAVLVELQQHNLKDMNIASVGHRLTILKGVYEVKIKQNVAIEEDDYVPLSADSNASGDRVTQDDIARIIHQIKLRDDHIKELELDLKYMRDNLDRMETEQKKLREETLPMIRMAKDRTQALPTPDGLESNNALASPNLYSGGEAPRSGGGIIRRFSNSNKKGGLLFSGNNNKMPSPTIHESASLDPSAAAMAASNHLTSSFNSDPRGSPHLSNQPSPTSPPPMPTPRTARDGSSRAEQRIDDGASMRNQQRGPGPSPSMTDRKGSSASAYHDPADFMKSFRVSMEEPCHKVLPVALKKYRIEDDPSQYSLYIVHGDQERCLGSEERPLILFKKLANEGKKPMFMLRKHATPDNGYTQRSESVGGPPLSAGPGSGASIRGLVPNSQSRVQSYASYASSTQLPGGVL